MFGYRIKYILENLPSDFSFYGEVAAKKVPVRTMDDGIFAPRSDEINKIISAYKDLKFTWQVAFSLYHFGHSLPTGVNYEEDEALIRAYSWCLSNNSDPSVTFALALAGKVEMRAERRLVNALLLCEDYDLERAAVATGFPKDALRIYEQLFYNVVDRRGDAAMLAAHVYQATRLEEMLEGYVNPGNTDKILWRTGYNNGMDHVLHLAGTPQGRCALNDMALSTAKEKMEEAIMRNGLLMVSSGFINQRHNAVGIQRAQAMLSAEKTGGAGKEENTGGVFDIGMAESVYRSLKQMKRAEADVAQAILVGARKEE